MWNGEDKELLLISLFTVIFNHVSQMYLCTEISLVPKADQKESHSQQTAELVLLSSLTDIPRALWQITKSPIFRDLCILRNAAGTQTSHFQQKIKNLMKRKLGA